MSGVPSLSTSMEYFYTRLSLMREKERAKRRQRKIMVFIFVDTYIIIRINQPLYSTGSFNPGRNQSFIKEALR